MRQYIFALAIHQSDLTMSIPSPALEPASLSPATLVDRAKHPDDITSSIAVVDELDRTGSETTTSTNSEHDGTETFSTDSDDVETTFAAPNSTPSSWTKQAYSVLETPSRAPRRLKVITIGAGASALNFAHEVSTSDLDIDLVCYEKNPEIGGTWFENKYPGCACDIPSVNYQLSWAPAVWSTYYSTAPEILAYFKKVADDYDLRKYVRLSHRIVEAVWDEASQEWMVKVEDLTTGRVVSDRCNVLINAAGVLNKWKWPAIKGRETFEGPMLHSANWDDSVALGGKRVAVIGGGSSAVQIVPNIQPIVGSMKCFVRSTSWVTAGFGQRFAGKEGKNFKYSEAQKEIFRNDPEKYLKYRKNIESELNVRFKFILNGSPEQATARKVQHTHVIYSSIKADCRCSSPKARCERNWPTSLRSRMSWYPRTTLLAVVGPPLATDISKPCASKTLRLSVARSQKSQPKASKLPTVLSMKLM